MSTRQQQWEALPQARKDAGWLWTKLHSEIIEQCEMLLNPDYFEPTIPPLPDGAVLSYAEPWFEKILIALRCASGDYVMDVSFDEDLLAVRYAVDRDPFPHDLLVVRRRGDSLLQTHDGALLGAEETARRIVMALTYRSF
jgi:hypothetical protein